MILKTIIGHIDQKVVSLKTDAPNVNNNPFSNHGGVSINMIETDDYWCMIKAIVPIGYEKIEIAVGTLSVK